MELQGLANSLPYINHFIETDSDIIAITEHWLCPCNLNKLEEIHPGYIGFGCADSRLNESSVLIRGCGGVGFVWNQNLPISPVTQISSDRFVLFKYPPPMLTVHYTSSVYTSQVTITLLKNSLNIYQT